MNKQVLIETQIFKPKPFTVTESVKDGKNLIVEGVLATVAVKNGNGRYYSKDLWNREINKYMDLVKDRRACGELDHPESQVVNLKNVSHLITNIWWEGDNIMGKLEILPTPSGNIVSALFQNNIPVGVSSRGMGSLKQVGEIMEVQDDFELLCWDFVSTPSNPGSFMHTVNVGIKLNESLTRKTPQNKYAKANEIITELLCSHGTCPLF